LSAFSFFPLDVFHGSETAPFAIQPLGRNLEGSRLSNPSEANQIGAGYTTRIQKGGALLEEMRQLVRFWSASPTEELKEAAVRANLLNKATRTRAADILRRTFIPRFVNGPVRNAWTLARPLEDVQAPPQIIKPVYFWITARAEPMIADFSREFLMARSVTAHTGIEQSEVLGWLATKGCRWSDSVSTKVARGLLAALRDFGVLEGRGRKNLMNARLPIGAFAYIAFCLHNRLGCDGSQLAFHADWQLFLLSIRETEQNFFEAHQRGLLQYHAAGNTVSLTFPCDSLEEYAHVVISRSA